MKKPVVKLHPCPLILCQRKRFIANLTTIIVLTVSAIITAAPMRILPAARIVSVVIIRYFLSSFEISI
ncbi:hypothetical protein [Methanolobus chelungpuianus]|uniref:hypothetical protein n=1 Tax=Methanolobus chelungpuianus TaxID=502115 RepID=UPI0021147B55|nr:hypothetical protein [Methanolobus chelungpuianus]